MHLDPDEPVVVRQPLELTLRVLPRIHDCVRRNPAGMRVDGSEGLRVAQRLLDRYEQIWRERVDLMSAILEESKES